MTRKTQKMMKSIGITMAIGSAVAAASASMCTTNQSAKKSATKAVHAVSSFVNNVSSMMR